MAEEARNEEAEKRVREYFARNGIKKFPPVRDEYDLSLPHRDVIKIEGEEYWEQHFKTGLDDFLDGVNIDSNAVLFDALLKETRKYKDLFEPCCQSGLLGCWLAGNIKGKYTGMDRSYEGIMKAKRRAVINNLSTAIFKTGDVMEYEGKHEVVIGRNVINNGEYAVNEKMLENIMRISRRFVLIEGTGAYSPAEEAVWIYEQAFKEHGISFRLVHPPIETSTKKGNVFVLEGTRK